MLRSAAERSGWLNEPSLEVARGMVPAAHRMLGSGPRLRRARSLALAVVAAALITPTVAAAPPEGVAFDGQVTVTVTQGDGPETGLPLAGATVTLTAAITDFPDDPPIQVLTERTFSDGIAAFDGVARGEEDGPTVHLSVSVALDAIEVAGECTVTTSWSGVVIDVVATESVEIALTAMPSTVTSCPTPSPTATSSPTPSSPTPSATPTSPAPATPSPAATPRPTRTVGPAIPGTPRPRPRATLPRTDLAGTAGWPAGIDRLPLALAIAAVLGTALIGLGVAPGRPGARSVRRRRTATPTRRGS